MIKEYEKILPQIARKAVIESFTGESLINKNELITKYPELKEKRATFVTINKLNGDLRGCIGSLVAHRPLIDDVIHNAKAAAFNDYRFNPLSAEELQEVEFEVSVLSPLQKIEYSDIDDLINKIIPFKDGIVLEYGPYRATFLPQVWDKLPDFNLFFSHLCIKAGLNKDCLIHHPDIYKYNVTEIKEFE